MMMSREIVELDFFSMEKEKGQKSIMRDFQSVISKINPQLIRNVIASASEQHRSLPVPVHEIRSDSEISLTGTTPLTMFYNGEVMVFNLSKEMAENIMKMAGEAAASRCVTDTTTNGMLGNVTAELPMARKKSLQRFLAKRKARLTGSGPYQRELENISSTTRG